MIACAQCCSESYYVSAKLPLRPAHKEWETTAGTPEARSEASRATWGWPTTRESAPCCARWYPWRSQEELGGMFLGQQLTRSRKTMVDNSMLLTQWSTEDVRR